MALLVEVFVLGTTNVVMFYGAWYLVLAFHFLPLSWMCMVIVSIIAYTLCGNLVRWYGDDNHVFVVSNILVLYNACMGQYATTKDGHVP